MKKSLQSLVLFLAVLLPMSTNAYEQLDDGVYCEGSTLYITSSVNSLGSLQLNPSVIYCYATIPPTCMSNTFAGYNAELYVPTSSMVSYFSAQYWCNFTNVQAGAVEPQSVTISQESVELEIGEQLSLSAVVSPSNATPSAIEWSSTNTSVATVSAGKVTAISAGECYISATCVDKQAFCHVTVIPERVTITIDKQEASLLPNHLMTLTATCTPATTDLAVTSSNMAVAIPRYVNGTIQVIGVAEGTAIITVATADGWCIPAECIVTVYTELGDVNCDGYVDISDVSSLIDHLLGNEVGAFSDKNADTDCDGDISISDVSYLIDYLLGNIDLYPPATETFTVNGVSFKMVAVEGGTFMMGATEEQGSDDPFSNEFPVHEVTLSDFSIGQTEVTQELWLAVMGTNLNTLSDDLSCPMFFDSFGSSGAFISKLNELTGKHFRLPTEAEWEFAARGGNKSKGFKYAGSKAVDEVAWYDNNSDGMIHPVARKATNELGLYDMSGNMAELCYDWYESYSSEPQTNPIGHSGTAYDFPVLRGGCSSKSSSYSRVSCRDYSMRAHVEPGIGLRLAMGDGPVFPEDLPPISLSQSEINLESGSQIIIDILNGNGKYTITCDTVVVSTEVSGNQMIVTGKCVGSTVITITDNFTQTQATLTVVVESKGEIFTVNGVSFKMIAVEGGTFNMGATDEQGSDAQSNERPVHEVTLSSYSIGETEVTQDLWDAVMSSNTRYSASTQLPVKNINKQRCLEFISKLNELTGKTFRLPTEAEWEFAARGGNLSRGYKYAGSNDISEVAWYKSNSSDVQPVATKAPNELGLYDMSGNVWEWVQDWCGAYSSGAQTDPTGPTGGTMYVCRGGRYSDEAWRCRVSARIFWETTLTGSPQGFRLVL